MRHEGFHAGTDAIQPALSETLVWLADLLRHQALEGLWNTVVLTHVALGVTGLFAVVTFPFVCLHLHGLPARRMATILLIVLRTTPEYIIA